MTISEGYREMEHIKKKPNLDYPYLGIPDEDEDEILERAAL